MSSPQIVLDSIQGICLDTSNPPFDNYQAFKSSYEGLRTLAGVVREFERKYIASDPYAANVVMHVSSNVPSLVPCAFNWFSTTLVNYLRLVALVDLMTQNSWKSKDLVESVNAPIIKAHCKAYVSTVAPEVYLWRNKVAAHFAATDPFRDDNLGTLEHSIMNPVSFKYPYYYVGGLKKIAGTAESELPTWALTETYELLAPRLWPEVQLSQLAGGA